MWNHNRLNDFFIYPRVEKADAIRVEIQHLARLQESLPPGLEQGLLDLMQAADHQRQFAHLAPHLTHLEFLLLCMLTDSARRLRKLEESRWVHPPFP